MASGTAFFTPQWADAVREAVNTKRSEEYEATKLPLYWNWVDVVGAELQATLTLAVDGVPGNGSVSKAFMAMEFDGGQCTKASIVDEQAALQSRWVLSGSYADWRQLMSGYDTNKAIMYRKLRLEHGDVFDFFNRVYFFIEALMNLAKVETTFETA